ncbi:MAG TPA: hypothetical protein VG826_12885 [Pirellulales bacterium]|nr:hypothetical protein [Pirellulales bacterium]
MRFSLRWMFGGVAFAAIGCASLIYASEPISKALGAVLFVFLMVAVLGAIFSGRNRRFWAGCAVVGSIYVATAYLPPSYIQLPQSTTSEILEWLHQKIVRKIEVEASAQGRLLHPDFLPIGPFHAAGQSLATFAWAIAGGIVAGRFRRDE